MLSTSTEYHDSHAKHYDEGYQNRFWQIYNDVTWNYIKKYLPKNKRKSMVLDAGGGTGLWATKIAKLGYSVVLTDVSKGMLEVAREKVEKEGLQHSIQILEMDITNMKQFRNGQFELSLAEGDPVSYCSNPKKAIAELARVTKRGGFVTLSVDNKLKFASRLIMSGDHEKSGKALKKGIADMQGDDHTFPAHLFTFEELEAICSKHRLKPVQRIGKHVWVKYGEPLEDDTIFNQILQFELKYSSLPSVAGNGGHIALVAKKI